ncbi:MAG: hypothetical protein KBONHNOK_00002 [Candidatus Methanoperedenaceae archaeon GB50]|nr:MAG: hypothetical protein KBONHNOK_00002 [Candidatus Methanoperedenaceae archaeon GB50]
MVHTILVFHLDSWDKVRIIQDEEIVLRVQSLKLTSPERMEAVSAPDDMNTLLTGFACNHWKLHPL